MPKFNVNWFGVALQRGEAAFMGMYDKMSRRRKVLTVAAAVVVFCTVYALILPALTLDSNTADSTPGIALDADRYDHTLTAEDGSYKVTVGYNDDAQLPAEAKLSVKALDKDSEGYKQARKAVIVAGKQADGSFDSSKLGMAALDISILDGNGAEVEPQAAIDVAVQLEKLPKDANGETLSVHHIVVQPDDANGGASGAQAAEEAPAVDKATAKKAPAAPQEDADDGSSAASADGSSGSEAGEAPAEGADAAAGEADAGESGTALQSASEGASADDADAEGDAPASEAAADDAADGPAAADIADADQPASVAGDTADDASADEPAAKAQPVSSAIKLSGAGATAQFSATGFSTYTITWTKGGDGTDASTRVGYVTMRYVNATGGVEVDTSVAPAADLMSQLAGDGGIVNIADWANNGASSRVAGHKFLKATIGDRDGAQITGLKIATNDIQKTETDQTTNETTTTTVTVYQLYYTSDDTVDAGSTWTPYADSSSGAGAANADVFLFYEVSLAPVNIHFMTLGGQAIKDSAGNDLVATMDASAYRATGRSNTGGTDDLATYARGNAPTGYGLTTDINASNSSEIWWMNGGSKQNFRFLNYDADNAQLQWARADKQWSDFPEGTPDIYVSYSVAGNLSVKVHRIDAQGNSLGDTTLVLENNGTVNLGSAGGVDNYTPRSICYGWDADAKRGTEFTTMTYTRDNSAWATSADGTPTAGFVTEVWAIYDKDASMDVTIHHVNAFGAQVAPDATHEVAAGTPLTADAVAKADGRTSNYAYALYFKDGDTRVDAASIAYSCDSDGNWSSTSKATADAPDADTPGGLVTDVYLEYTPTAYAGFAIHFVDEAGGKLAEDGRAGGTSFSKSTWDGFSLPQANPSGVGDYQYGYAGAFGSNKIERGQAIMYRVDDGVCHSGIGDTSNDRTKANTVEIFAADGTSPVIIDDIWQVYGGANAKKGVTVHHVDASGNKVADDTFVTVAAGGAFAPADNAANLAGYGYKEARFGGADGTAFTGLQFAYDSAQSDAAKRWSSTYTSDGQTTPASTGDAPVNEVWLVYDAGATFTVHFIDGGGNGTDEPDRTLAVGLGDSKELAAPDPVNEAGKTNDAAPGSVTQTVDGSVKTLDYVTTRIGSPNGPDLDQVQVSAAGEVSYTRTLTSTLSYTQRAGRWTGASHYGHTFTVTRDDNGNFAIEDSQMGRSNLTLQNGTGSEDGSVYVATIHHDGMTTKYTATMSAVSGATPTTDGLFHTYQHKFNVEMVQTMPSASRDIYQIYGRANDSSADLTLGIGDDLAFSGRYISVPSDALATLLAMGSYRDENGEWQNGKVSDATYTWYRTVTTINADGSTGASTTEMVRRKAANSAYNIAYDAAQRTWLDVAADEGDDIWTAAQQVSYHVTLDYKLDGVQQPTITSNEEVVDYYGQLENGGFETPAYAGGGVSVSNAGYAEVRGVWQTTGVGGTGHIGQDIEVINTASTEGWNAGGYRWYYKGKDDLGNDVTYDQNYYNSHGNTVYNLKQAYEGNQFVELNAETAGALYQDVITHPDRPLSYGLSHRARGTVANTTPEYDTMYLVIMPTSLAMTSAQDGGPLVDQDDLEKFIDAHGGYATQVATAEEDEVIWQDRESGILVRKISSSDQAWHSIEVTNGYNATSSLTRFFFVAGPTSADRGRTVYTQGNFLDAVHFSQSLPPTEGFHLTVTKTFTGLTQEEVASLAADNDGTANANPFKLTITNQNIDANVSAAMRQNDALANAELTFTAVKSGADYTFTPTATTTPTYVDCREDDDGNVVMTWTFSNQNLQVGDTEAQDQTFAYTVAESGADVEGRSLSPSASATVTGGSSDTTRAGNYDATANVSSGATAAFAFSNAYRDNSSDDAPQFAVRKVFSGATLTTVDRLLSASPGYSVTITKTADANGNPIAAGSQPRLTVNADADRLPSNVRYSLVEDDSGRVALTWIISSSILPGTRGYAAAMGTPGTYTVSERGFTPTAAQTNGDNNKLTTIIVNGTDEGVVLADSSGATISDYASATTATKSGLVAGGDDGIPPQFGTTSGGVQSSVPEQTTVDPATNVLIAKTDFGSGGYLVWSADTLGADMRQVVVNFINETEGLGAGDGTRATLGSDTSSGNVSFRSGHNPGSLVYDKANAGALAVYYDPTTGELRFSNQPQVGEGDQTTQAAASWSAYYTGIYTATEEQAAEFRIANIYDPIVKIVKVTSGENQTPLSGVAFRLYKYDADGQTKLYYLSKSTQADPLFGAVDVSEPANTVASRVGSNRERADEQAALAFTTGSDGVATIGTLPEGDPAATYYLEEATSPAGYDRVPDIAFTVSDDGVVSLVGADGSAATQTDTAKVTWRDPYYSITVFNGAGFVLPHTGGLGGAGAVLGIVLAAIAAGVLLALRRRAHGQAAAFYGVGAPGSIPGGAAFAGSGRGRMAWTPPFDFSACADAVASAVAAALALVQRFSARPRGASGRHVRGGDGAQVPRTRRGGVHRREDRR